MADAQQNTPFSGNGPSDANQPFPQQNGQFQQQQYTPPQGQYQQQPNQGQPQTVNYLVPEGPGLAKGSVASPIVRSLCLAHLVLTSCHEDMLLDCAIACVPRYMGSRTQHRVIDKTRFLLQPRYTQSEYVNKNQITYNNQPDLRTPKRGFESPDKNNVPKK